MDRPIATIAKTKAIMAEFGLYPNKGFGQNFIIEPKIIEKIAQASQADKNTAVIEVGPGIGALTEQLAIVARSVLAFEIDKKLINVLAHTLSDHDNVKIINEDFLTCDLNYHYQTLKQTCDQIIMVANLPYYITTTIIFKVIESKGDFSSLTFMVQKELADRFMAKPNTKDYNALSVMLQHLYDINIVMRVSPNVFIPKPAVDSIVVRFVPKDIEDDIDQDKFFQLIKACFIQRRKTIYNNLKQYLDQDINMILTRVGISTQRRAESLTLDEFKSLYGVIYEG
ncbi:MAG: 16S rRNA (adenine(1518)-N(6)/adenine(1519)-N(6))-dimethyltransferase RsmA [Erysipelotrichaceae bacterium]|nr:16S rRNA (adenine(1518)-N(6)/adenine(1519)-N(6))-dimethyltransferase RsmA [Erysipelotrichaceae bacterium]